MTKSSKTGEAFAAKAGEAPAYWYRTVLWNVLMSADQTLGEFTLQEQLVPANAAAPTHVHERAAEGFYVLDGEVEFTLGENDTVITGGRGTALWVPKWTRHAFRVISDTNARILNFYTPGGFDDHLPYFAVPAEAQTLPAPGTRGAELDKERKLAPAELRAAYLHRISDLHEGTWEVPTDD